MKTLPAFALSISAATAFLAGCSGSQPPVGAPRAMPQSRTNRNIADEFATGQRTFQFTGSKQVFVVPRGVYQIKVWAHGGSGANDVHRYEHMHRSIGGYGGRVTAIVPVSPHEKLFVYVGGDGVGHTGGFNGGGSGSDPDSPTGLGGGGASDVRERGQALSRRILVAGGGGGAGGDGFGYTYHDYANGGKGGGLLAGSGEAGEAGSSSSQGGGGGSQSVGGSGGAAQSECPYYGFGEPGNPGALGAGGSGGDGGVRSYTAGGGGGGGGGGYFGGGGGGAGCNEYSGYSYSGGGGGGGSSYVEPSATDVHMWKGWKGNEHGLIVFDW
jgi:hypothetical protein